MCQWGHIFAFLFQVICCLTSLFLKVPTHVSPSFNLNSGQGDSFLMNLLTCFFLPFLLPSFLAETADPDTFAASASFCSFGAGGSVNDEGRFNAKMPKWMLLIGGSRGCCHQFCPFGLRSCSLPARVGSGYPLHT